MRFGAPTVIDKQVQKTSIVQLVYETALFIYDLRPQAQASDPAN